MILLSILLTAGLDLSFPEFQPDDVSGNYIVSEYDVSGDEFIAVEVPSAELAESVALRTEAPVETSDVVTAIENMNNDNNQYWELFLDSYTVEVSHVSYSSEISPLVFYINGSGQIKSDSALSNYHVFFVPVSAGVVYTISDLSPLPYSNNYYRCGVVDSISNPTVLTNFFSKGYDEVSSFTVIPNQDGFLCFSSWNFNNSVSFVSNWVTYEEDSYTLSELGNAVMEIRSNNDMKFRILIFLTLINFAYPIVISSFKNFFGGGKNV